MIPASLPIAFFSALVRRCVDSYTGRLAPVAGANGIFSFGTIILAGSAFPAAALLYNTYNQLKNGTLVRVGTGHKFSSPKSSNSRHTIQRRVKNNSWFLRNARSCRNKYTDAVFKIAKQSYDSLHKLHPNGFLHDAKLNIKIPYFRSSESRECTPSTTSTKENCSIIYSNEQFERNHSNQELKAQEKKEQSGAEVAQKPATRSSAKNMEKPVGNVKTSKEVQTNKKKAKAKFRRHKIQRITRKTRSGRVYAYRL